MRVNRVLILMVAPIIFTGCVERYYPQEDDVLTGTLVVNAHLSSIPGSQTISISRSDKLLYPKYIPEVNCKVVVENLEGITIEFLEGAPGDYNAEIPEEFIREGDLYRLLLLTPEGNRYESEYSELHGSSPIDKIYYELESQPTSVPGETLDGIRFFIDFEVDYSATEFIRWELIETYEFHNPDYEGFIYSFDRVLRPFPDSLSDRQCWITGHVNSIYTLDAGNLNSPKFTYLPLNFVSNETQRLSFGYSLLVRQYSLDEPAFRYWDELKKNSQEMSGMYDRQPSLTPSNICNCQDPGEKILGFFSISGVSESRIFVKDVEGLEKYDVMFCYPSAEMPRLRYLKTEDLPVYISEAFVVETKGTHRGETELKCLDCRLRNGSSGDPPEYWPNR